MKEIGNDKIQGVILNILVYFDKVCRANNLKYALCGGTCLGAVRHKGFIPWDNDADVMMPREDYNKFIEIMQKDKSQFEVMTYQTTKNYHYPFAKLIDTKTILIEKMVLPIENLGVYIDIFPIDGVPSDEKIRKRFLRKVKTQRELIMFFIRRYKFFLGKLFGKTMSIFANWKTRVQKHDKLCQKYPLKDSEYFGWLTWNVRFYPKKCIEELIEWDFCGHKFFIPKGYDEYLTKHYGDYMTPPPKKKQVSHKILAYYK